MVIGGGNGSSVVLSALKKHRTDITAIVTTFDSGGSSGLLHDEFGYPPMGDLRQCLVALSEDCEETRPLRLASEFRFSKESSLNGHSLGNLLLAALTSLHDDLEDAIEQMSRLLRIKGRVLPVSTDASDLCAELEDGSVLRGESTIDLRHAHLPAIKRVFLDPGAKANPRAIAAINEADAIVMGPGDLYTSIIPNLLVDGIAEAVRSATATTVYVCNLMTKEGETGGFSASDFVGEIYRYLDGHRVDWALVNSRLVPVRTRRLYEDERAAPVKADLDMVGRYARAHMSIPLSQSGDKMRHDPDLLAEAILSAIDMGVQASAPRHRSPVQESDPVESGVAD